MGIEIPRPSRSSHCTASDHEAIQWWSLSGHSNRFCSVIVEIEPVSLPCNQNQGKETNYSATLPKIRAMKLNLCFYLHTYKLWSVPAVDGHVFHLQKSQNQIQKFFVATFVHGRSTSRSPTDCRQSWSISMALDSDCDSDSDVTVTACHDSSVSIMTSCR